MKIRTKLLCLSSVTLLLVAALAAALMHYASRARQLRALSNLGAQQLESYTRLRTSPLLLLPPAQASGSGAAEGLPALGERLGQLRARLDAAYAQLERGVQDKAQWEHAPHRDERARIDAVRAACEAWMREDVGPLAALPPHTRLSAAHWLQVAAGFAQRVEPRLVEAEQLEKQERAESTLRSTQLSQRNRLLATVGPLVALGVLLALLLGVVYPVDRALRVLLTGVERLGAGQLDAEVHLRSGDELAVLASAFNRMARELRESLVAQVQAKDAQAREVERALKHDSALLEQQVRARTAELQAANQQLSDSLRQLQTTQAQLHFADRLASVGMLAAGVAHEVNNPLAFVLGNVRFAREQLSQEQLPEDQRAEVLEALDEAFVGADRVRGIVQDLKAFSRPHDAVEAPVDLQEVLRVAVKMVGSELRHRARVVTHYAEAPRVRGSEARLSQVFLNLLINAAQAIAPGHPERNEVRVSLYAGGTGAVVEIHDTGAGIAPEDQARIFDPFFTTKPVGTGTGLGLSVCHGIVSALGGEIEVQSTPGAGTTFRVLLPADAAQAAASPLSQGQARVPTRTQRLLVVDDEPAIGSLLRRMLGTRARVTYVGSGEEALAQLEREGPFDAVLCDVMMPGMTGLELHARLAREERGRERSLIFMTGGALTPDVQRFLEQVPNPTLSKPFGAEPLLALLAAREA